MVEINNIENAVAILKPDLRVDTLQHSPDMYAAFDRDYDEFKGHTLVAAFDCTEAWSQWERHPAGDEIVMLLSGEVELILRGTQGDETLRLAIAGEFVVIPRGIWHTARPVKPGRMLFITPGAGTEHDADPRAV